MTIYNLAGATDVVVDVAGWYTDATGSGAASAFTAVTPARVIDTRDGTGGITGPLPGGTIVDLQVTGQGGVPAAGVGAVILNATVTQPADAGYLTLSPTGPPRPFVSDLDYAAGETRANLAVVRVGDGGRVNLFTTSRTHVVLDVAGWFS